VICYGEVMNITHLKLNALIHAFFCRQAKSSCDEYRTLVHPDQAPCKACASRQRPQNRTRPAAEFKDRGAWRPSELSKVGIAHPGKGRILPTKLKTGDQSFNGRCIKVVDEAVGITSG